MDKATIFGLGGGIICVIAGMLLEHVDLGLFLNPSPILIVFGGTFGATVASFGLKETKNMGLYLRRAFTVEVEDFKDLIQTFTSLATKARREGLLALEGDLDDIKDRMFMNGLKLVIDGTDPAVVRDILETESEKKKEEDMKGFEFWEAIGGFAPTMGIVGTVAGLMAVLQGFGGGSAEVLVKGIGVAFIATFFGIAAANIVALPISTKLKYNAKESTVYREIIIAGILSIQAGDAPRVVLDKLLAFLQDEELKLELSKEGEGG